MSTSEPVRYRAPGDSVDAWRQEMARTRAELAATIEELAGRLDPRRQARVRVRDAMPVLNAVAAGLVGLAAARVGLGSSPRARGLSWLTGLAAGAGVYTATRLVLRAGHPGPDAAAGQGRADGPHAGLDRRGPAVEPGPDRPSGGPRVAFTDSGIGPAGGDGPRYPADRAIGEASGEPATSPAAGGASGDRVVAHAPYPTAPGDHAGDVVDVLVSRHRQVDELFARVRMARGTDRTEEFAILVEFLQRHERVEQEVVHTVLNGLGGEAAAVADQQLAEEGQVANRLSALASHPVTHPEFDDKLAELMDAVHAHAAHEESVEFPLLRARLPREQLLRMATQVRAAEGNALW